VYVLALMGGALSLASLIPVSHWLSFDRRQLLLLFIMKIVPEAQTILIQQQ